MEVNWALQKAMTDKEDEYRAKYPVHQECAWCQEVYPEDEVEDGLCGGCIKERDAVEAKADEIKEQTAAMKRLGTDFT